MALARQASSRSLAPTARPAAVIINRRLAHRVRLGRFEEQGPKTCLLHGDRALELGKLESDLPADPVALLADAGAMRRVSLHERGQPPQDARRHLDKVRWMAPMEPERVLLRGGAEADFSPQPILGHGARLPPGTWHTGVAAVVGADRQVAGWTVFHRVDETLAMGPWLVTPDEAGDPLGFLFSAFVDDLPSIRPVKALLDWQGEIDRAEPSLGPGDVVALCAPPQQGGGALRSSLASDGQVLCRLEATQ